ncbi:hypothetical protein QM351_03360 [Streptococcus parasanguinis]|uniref:DUF6574 domain-containing protein n=1 Tax=Streptococcus parasanguinis TaxID=1318 RepID=UPI0039C3F7D2
MSKQDWLDYFEAVNGRSASAEEIAQALAAGEFQEEVVVPEASQAPEFVAAPTAPVEEPVAAPEAPEFVAAPQEPVSAPQAPEFVAAPQEPVSAPQAPEFTAAPTAPVEAPAQGPAPQTAQNNGPAFQQAPQQAYQQQAYQQQAYQQPSQAGYQQAPFQGQPGQPYPAQPSQFGVAVGGYWNWFLSALKRPTAVNQPKALNGILQYVLTAFVMSLATFFTASGYTGGYGADFRAFLIILIMAYFNIYAFQVAGFFVRRIVLQDKEYSYGRSFEEFGRLSVYALPVSLFAFLVGLVKAYEFYGFLNFLIFFLYTVGTLYVVYQALNNTKFKADKFILLVASIAILIVFAALVVYLDRQILEQAIMGSITNTPNFGDLGNFGY